MKCKKCGAELEDGVLFCRECGNKVVDNEVRICTECGAAVAGDAIFCPECGNRLDEITTNDRSEASVYDVDLYTEEETDNNSKYRGYIDLDSIKTTAKESVKAKGNNTSKSKLAMLLLAVILLMMLGFPRILFHRSSSTGTGQDQGATSANIPMVESVIRESKTLSQDNTIEKGSEYAFMSDEWNVYIATAISDSVIQIARWDKTLSSDKSVEHDEDIGAFKINDPENEFYWIDDEHTAFAITFEDKNDTSEGHNMKNRQSVVFTINNDSSDKNKGTNYNKKIACYSYENDSWHLYRAIPLHDNLVKIEVWYRSSSDDDYLYGYDLCVINPDLTDTDFEWTDDEHTSFTITMQDGINDYYWKKPEFVAFILENPKFKYKSVAEYLD